MVTTYRVLYHSFQTRRLVPFVKSCIELRSHIQNLRDQERLGEEPIRTGCKCLLLLLGPGVGRAHDDGHVLRELLLLLERAYPLRALDTVHGRHLPIHEDDVDIRAGAVVGRPVRCRREVVERLEAVVGDLDAVPLLGQLLLQHALVHDVVFDEQDAEV